MLAERGARAAGGTGGVGMAAQANVVDRAYREAPKAAANSGKEIQAAVKLEAGGTVTVGKVVVALVEVAGVWDTTAKGAFPERVEKG